MCKENTCCVTGHRDIPEEKISYVQNQLRQEALRAIQSGYTRFLSGFASGADLIFAEIIRELKKEYPITLEAVLPYLGRVKSPDQTFQRLLKACDSVYVQSVEYNKSCFMTRNRYMVNHSALVIAVYDGRRSGGTAATVRYAHKMERAVREVRI